jgi:hypothetical protein
MGQLDGEVKIRKQIKVPIYFQSESTGRVRSSVPCDEPAVRGGAEKLEDLQIDSVGLWNVERMAGLP